jgi:hypothetical protein
MKKIITSFAIAITINCSSQTYVTIPDANFVTYLQGLIPAAMSGNQLDTSSALVTTNTHSISVAGLSIANLSGVQYFSSLTYLVCGANSLTSLPVLPNTLAYLACGGNYLTSLPSLPNSLTYIDAHQNSLTTLPTLPTSLGNIFCNANALTALPTLPTSLLYLNCSSNNLSSLPAIPGALIQLECSDNNLATLPALPNSLTVLYCANNNLTGLPNFPAFPTSLQQLYCNNNNIVCFPVFPHSIVSLGIDPNPYTCLPNYIAAMPYLDTVNHPICNPCIPAAGIDRITAIGNQITVYPNPTNAIINLTINQSDNLKMKSVEVYNTIGDCVHRQTITFQSSPLKEEAFTIDVSDLTEGIYNISISSSEGAINKRLVIVH